MHSALALGCRGLGSASLAQRDGSVARSDGLVAASLGWIAAQRPSRDTFVTFLLPRTDHEEMCVKAMQGARNQGIGRAWSIVTCRGARCRARIKTQHRVVICL